MPQFNELYLEYDHFVEISGEMFCTKDTCEGCKFINQCQNQEQEVFSDTVIPVRSIIKTDNTPQPYSLETDDIENKSFSQGRFSGDTIPHTNKRVYKVINDISNTQYKNREINHIIFQEGKHYCIKQRCSNCPLLLNCNHSLEVRESKDYIVALDLSAQEPRSFLLSTRLTKNIEKVWLKTFANDFIRSLKEYHTLELLFKHNNIDTSISNEVYHLWLDKSFFYDKTDIFKLQIAVNNYYKDQTEQNKQELSSITDKIVTSYKDFEAKLKLESESNIN